MGSFVLRLQSSVFCPLSSVFCLHSSVFSLPCSVFRVPCSVFSLPCSVFRLQSYVFRVPCSVFRLHSSVFSLLSSVFCLLFCFLFPVSVFCVLCLAPCVWTLPCTATDRQAQTKIQTHKRGLRYRHTKKKEAKTKKRVLSLIPLL